MSDSGNGKTASVPEVLQPNIWVGIDWGTHSSKWAFYPSRESSIPVVGPIRNSLLLRNRAEETLVFCPDSPGLPSHRVARSLKKVIIDDPFGAFWGGEREDTGMSLGETVAFSLCALLNDLFSELAKRALNLNRRELVDIGFSLPNWVQEEDERQRSALQNFHQAVMVSIEVFTNQAPENLPRPIHSYPIGVWRELVRTATARRRSEHHEEWLRDESGISPQSLIRKDLYCFGHTRCGYIVESCAAGLPYLRAMGNPVEGKSARIRKILVVDVGAGSTDIGYMLRTISGEKWVLNYFTPGNTHGLAGDALTQRIQDHFRQQGKPIAFEQAEEEKIVHTAWQNWQVSQDWKEAIARNAAEYIAGVPDNLRLYDEPPLEIILTGGSGPSIPGLAELIKTKVIESLGRRGVGPVRHRTEVADVVLPEYGLGDAITYARRVVSLGAADREKPRLEHKTRLERPGLPPEVNTWRGSS